MTDAESIASSLGIVLGRGFRSDLYQHLTANIATGFTEATYPIVSAIARAGEPISAAQLAPTVGLDRSVVSRRTRELADHGLIEFIASDTDARQSLVALTTSGTSAIIQSRKRLHAAIEQHTAGWTEHERHTFATLIERFTSAPLSSRTAT